MHPQNVNAHHKPSLPASCSWTSGMSQRLTYLQTLREDSKVCLTHLMGHGVHPIRFQWSSPPSCPRRNLIVLSHMTRSLPVSLLLKITSSRSRFWHRVWGARYLLGINTWESKGADAGWPGEAIELQRRPNKRSQELWADSCPWECPHTRPDACASTSLSHSPDAGSPRREWPWARWLWGDKARLKQLAAEDYFVDHCIVHSWTPKSFLKGRCKYLTQLFSYSFYKSHRFFSQFSPEHHAHLYLRVAHVLETFSLPFSPG